MRKRTTIASLALLLVLSVVFNGCSSFTEMRLRPQIEQANEAFDRGHYALAATLYESLSDRCPSLPAREDLKMRQGISLYTLGGYHDARNAFLEYLKLFPQSPRKSEAQVYLNKISALLSPDNPSLKAAVETAKKDLNQLQQLQIKNPYNPAVKYAIGNLYYEMGNYKEAVRAYYDALTIDAVYKEKALIQQRMVIDAQGNPQPLTADEIDRIERDNQPLVIFNTSAYKAREPYTYYGNADNRFFNVTGLLRNQSSHFVNNAVVEVRFLNAQHQILDVAVIPIGPMGPGEVRPFRAEADSFDNIYNITQYDCIPSAE